MGMILSAAGALTSFAGGLQQAVAGKAIAEENARIQEANARLEAEGIRTKAEILRSQTRFNFRARSNEAGQMKANADVKSSRAAVQETINATNTARQREAGRALMAKQKAGFAAANVVESTGSPLSILARTAGLIERDVKEQQYFGDLKSAALYEDAALERLGGEYALAGATLDKSTGLATAKLEDATAGATLLTGQRRAALTRMAGKQQSTGMMLGSFGNLLSDSASIYDKYKT